MDTRAALRRPRSPVERSILLGRLLARDAHLLHAQAARHSRDGSGAEEAFQDACVQFLRRFEGAPDDLDHALRWMLVTVKRRAWRLGRRAATEAARRARPRPEEQDRDPVDRLAADPDSGTAERFWRSAETAELVACCNRLKHDQRVALALFAIGYSYREIAARQGWSQTKVNRCIAEGRAALREMKGGENDQLRC